MAQSVHLRTPPIHEALIDFVFSGTNADDAVLHHLIESMQQAGWKKDQISEATFETFVGPPKGKEPGPVLRSSASSAVVGYSLTNPSGTRIIQVREDRLTVSHVNDYDDWEHLERDAKDALGRFVEFMRPDAITRIATRFINRISVAQEHASSFNHYLISPPVLIEGLGSGRITDFIRRQVIRGLDSDFVAVLNVATASPTSKESSKALILDIDVFKEQRIALDDDCVSSCFHALRAIKNTIFFGSLTDAALEPFR